MIIIPVYNQLILPESTLYFPADSLNASAGVTGINPGEKVIFIISRDNRPRTEYTEDGFYTIGVSGMIQQSGVSGFYVIRTYQRVNVENVIIRADHTITANV